VATLPSQRSLTPALSQREREKHWSQFPTVVTPHPDPLPREREKRRLR